MIIFKSDIKSFYAIKFLQFTKLAGYRFLFEIVTQSYFL